MANTYFKFKQFTINQDRCAMKVGTDGVLLGSYTNVENVQNILDIGTGTGLIALMLAQRSKAKIIAIEIEKQASIQAKENIENSKFNSQIEVINASLQEYEKTTNNKFDLIVSNPPYFQNSYKAETDQRTTARHTTELTYTELILNSEKLLSEDGVICIIIPEDEAQNLIEITNENNLFVIDILKIKPTPTKRPKRVILTFSKTEKPLTQSELIIEDKGRHNYSDKYIELTKEFYLKF